MSRGPFWLKKVLNRNISLLTTFGVWAKSFCILHSNLPARLTKQNSMCQWNLFSRDTDSWKNILYHNHFRILDGIFPGLRQKISGRYISSAFICLEKRFKSHSLETNWFSLFFRYLRISFFWEFTQVFIGSVVRSELYVSTWLSSWEFFSSQKFFQNVIHFVGQSISGLRQNVPCTIVRTAIFVSSGTFKEEKCFERLCFFYMRKFGETFCEFDVKNSRELSELHYTCQERNFMRKNPMKKTTQFRTLGGIFRGLKPRVFWQERQNRTARVQKKLSEENTFEKKLKNLR